MKRSIGSMTISGIGTAVLVFMVMPTFAIVPFAFNSTDYLAFPTEGLSFRWFESYFTDSSWTGSTWRSLQIALAATAVAVAVGTAAAVALVRRNIAFRNALSTVVMFPIVAPTIVLAVGLFQFYSTLDLVGTFTGTVLAHALLGTPFVFVNVASRLRTFDTRLELAAQSLGASPSRTFLAVTEPIVRPAVVAGALFAFLASWDEFIIASFVAGVGNQTLPIRIFAGIRFEVDATNAAVAVLLITFTLLGMGLFALTGRWARPRVSSHDDAAEPVPALTDPEAQV